MNLLLGTSITIQEPTKPRNNSRPKSTSESTATTWAHPTSALPLSGPIVPRLCARTPGPIHFCDTDTPPTSGHLQTTANDSYILDTQSPRMYESNRKASRETCASSSSPASSPVTPAMDSPPSQPLFAEYGKQSATLENIGAWSSVQADPAASSAAAARTYDSAVDIHTLGKRYDTLSIAHNRPAFGTGLDERLAGEHDQNTLGFYSGGSSNHTDYTHSDASAAAAAAAAADTNASANVDYTALDEAILRGRSTTLPNIFAVPNPLRRFSAMASGETPISPGPISPVSSSNFGFLSRQGSVSYGNTNRTVSPLGLSLNMTKIHQTSSLDIQLTSPLETVQQPTGASRFGMMGAGIGVDAGASTSNNFSSADAAASPARRFSEYAADSGHSHALASYSMGSVLVPGGGGNPQTNGAVDGLNGSGVSHAASGGGASAKSQASSIAAAGSSARSTLATGLGDSSAYAPTLGYGPFGFHLPTMREEDHQATAASPPALMDSVLMRNMSSPPNTLALPQPHFMAPGMALGQGSISITSPASPVRRELRADASDSVADGAASSGSFLPPRVRSLKDIRRPSLDASSEALGDSTAAVGRSTADILLERTSDFHQAQPFHPLSNMSALHRRHSLAGTGLHMLSSGGSESAQHRRMGVGAMGPEGGSAGQGLESSDTAQRFGIGSSSGNEYASMYPPFMNTGSAVQPPFIAPGMSAYCVPNHSGHMGGLQPGQQTQFQHQSAAAYHQYPGTLPLARMPSGSSNGNPAYPGAIPRSGFYGGPMVPPPIPQNNSQPHAAFQQQPHVHGHAPSLLQAMPAAAQPPQSLQTQPQLLPPPHLRRASHPALAHGVQLPSIPLMSPAPALAGGAHSGPHPVMPNPATTITPNMPFADMGKGILFQSLPRDTRVFVVQFKGKRCDLYFAPSKGMEPKLIPALAASAIPVPASSADADSKAQLSNAFEPGTFVLVEADRGVDLGMIKEELTTPEAIRSFSNALADAASAAAGGAASGVDQQPDGSSVAAVEPDSAWPSSSNGHGDVRKGGARAAQSQPPSGTATATTSSSSSSGPGAPVPSPTSGPSASAQITASSVVGSAASAASVPAAHSSAGSVSSAKDVYIKRIFREADQREVADMMGNKVVDEQKALSMCQSKVTQRRLSMSVVDAEFQFDRRKLTFYFTADRRVDFRELVRELFKHFKTRIWMCQQTN